MPTVTTFRNGEQSSNMLKHNFALLICALAVLDYFSFEAHLH